jgi:cleavage and polyadenylation specificity factor subunit 2
MSATAITFQALYGVHTDETPVAYLLEVDGVCILLDCGWDEKFDVELLEPLRAVVSKIDLVLLSYPDLAHIGALPYAIKNFGLNAPIYCTGPVYQMGMFYLYDTCTNMVNFDKFDLNDIDAAFQENENFPLANRLNYQQKLALTGAGAGITITPFPAGHLIGGTIWKISKEADDIIYAVNFNHKRERHLKGCMLESFKRPTLLIMDAFSRVERNSKRKDRDDELVQRIMETLRGNGSVLLPVDTAGRVFEVLLTLEGFWQYQRLGYPVYLLNHVAKSVVEFAGRMIQWGSDELSKKFADDRQNPYEFRHIQCISSLEDLEGVHGPKVVLASSATLDSGFSREIFLEWCSDHRNQVLFTQRAGPTSLSSELLKEPKPRLLQLKVWRQVPLQGEELVEWRKKEAELEKERQVEKEKEEQLAYEREQQLLLENAMVVATDSDEELELAGTSSTLAASKSSRGGKFEHPWHPVFGATKAVNPATVNGSKLDPLTGAY